MRITPEKAEAFRCPRWNELPGIPLYMDQVVFVLEESLSPFAEEDGHVVTATMINNYVKQKVIIPPDGKRYKREQIATLIMVCLIKKVFSISEAIGLIGLLTENAELSDAYDMFCAELDEALKAAFAKGYGRVEGGFGADEAGDAGRAAISALTGKLLAQSIVSDWQERQKLAREQLAKDAKEKKTESKK
ncbi:MAG TPA: DUF1836 domain-containing protein [Clostridia bacterium]|nr:DUF1836 domain-containing protein [Clostridia bacterium]